MDEGEMEWSQAKVDITDFQAARRSCLGRFDRAGSVIMRPWTYSIIFFNDGQGMLVGCGVRWVCFVVTYVECGSDYIGIHA